MIEDGAGVFVVALPCQLQVDAAIVPLPSWVSMMAACISRCWMFCISWQHVFMCTFVGPRIIISIVCTAIASKDSLHSVFFEQVWHRAPTPEACSVTLAKVACLSCVEVLMQRRCPQGNKAAIVVETPGRQRHFSHSKVPNLSAWPQRCPV